MKNLILCLALVACPVVAQAGGVEATLGNVTVTERSGTQRIQTGPASKARVRVDANTELSLAPNTEVQIPAAASNSSSLQLITGKIRFLLKKAFADPSKKYQVQTPNAVMGIRGTEFLVDADRDRTIVCAFEGRVEVTAANGHGESRQVGANEGVVVAPSGKVSPPVTMDSAQMDWWRAETLVDTSESGRTRYRSLLDPVWHWGGPVTVDAIDPAVLHSEYQLLHPGAELWARGLRDQTPGSSLRTNASFKAEVTGALVPTPYYLLFADAAVLAKSGERNPEEAGLILNQAFWMLRSNSSHSLVLGRQVWNFGDGLILGSNPWTPLGNRYDGALVAFRPEGARVRLLGASLGDRVSSRDLEDFLAGAYVDSSKIPLEVYGLWFKRGGPPVVREANNVHGRYFIFGQRLQFDEWQPVFLNEEFAYQFGTIGIDAVPNDLRAYLGYADAGVTWSTGSLSGLVKAVYLRASGDETGGDGRFTSFMNPFHDTHRHLGVINLFPQLRNIQRLGASAVARYPLFSRPLTAQVDYSSFHKISTGDAFTPRGTIASELSLGNEIDLQFGYEPVPAVFFRLGGGRFHPGAAYPTATPAAYLIYTTGQVNL